MSSRVLSRRPPAGPGAARPTTLGARLAAGRAWFYDWMFREITAGWYREALARFPDGARVLDVGIGTGGAAIRCAELLVAKDLRVVGLDIDRAYIARCRRELAAAGLTDRVRPILGSVHEHADGPYDVVYFSASLMLIDDPVRALRHIATRLAPGGRIYFTQTFQHRRSPVLERVKPLGYLFTTIDFGRVTYESDFRAVVSDAGLELLELSTFHRKKRSSFRLAVARPVAPTRGAPAPPD